MSRHSVSLICVYLWVSVCVLFCPEVMCEGCGLWGGIAPVSFGCVAMLATKLHPPPLAIMWSANLKHYIHITPLAQAGHACWWAIRLIVTELCFVGACNTNTIMITWICMPVKHSTARLRTKSSWGVQAVVLAGASLGGITCDHCSFRLASILSWMLFAVWQFAKSKSRGK